MRFAGPIIVSKHKFMLKHFGDISLEFFMGDKPIMNIIDLIWARTSSGEADGKRKNRIMLFEQMRNDSAFTDS